MLYQGRGAWRLYDVIGIFFVSLHANYVKCLADTKCKATIIKLYKPKT